MERETLEHSVSVTAWGAGPKACGSHPFDGVWEWLPAQSGVGGWAGDGIEGFGGQAALTLKPTCSVITFGQHPLVSGLVSALRLPSPGFVSCGGRGLLVGSRL